MTSSVCSFILPECLCSAGAKNGNCDQDTGKCFCQEGATGDKCDTCLPYYSNTSTGCEKCSGCVLGLRDDNTALNATLDYVDVLQSTAEALQQADTLVLEYLAERVTEILGSISIVNESLLAYKAQEDNLTTYYNNLDGSLQDLQAIVSWSTIKTKCFYCLFVVLCSYWCWWSIPKYSCQLLRQFTRVLLLYPIPLAKSLNSL